MRLGLHASPFDPFPHPGHLSAWRQAIEAGACDGILAALQIDPTKERPTKRKPALTAQERIRLLRSHRDVQEIQCYTTEEQLRSLIEIFQPNCLIVGQDHAGDHVTGGGLGIPIFWARRDPEWSGTQFAKRIHDAYQEHVRCRS